MPCVQSACDYLRQNHLKKEMEDLRVTMCELEQMDVGTSVNQLRRRYETLKHIVSDPTTQRHR